MRYFKYNGSKKTEKIATRLHYRSMSKEERKAVRRDKFFNILALVIVFFMAIFCTLILDFLLSDISMPGNAILRVIYEFGKKALTFFCFVAGLIVGLLVAMPVLRLVKGESPQIKKKTISETCSHLRDFYGVCEPYIVTKCYKSSNESFTNRDVCVFVTEDELRVTANLIHGFVHERNDLGCCAFKFDELKVQESVFDNMIATEISDGENQFLLGRRAMGYIKQLK